MILGITSCKDVEEPWGDGSGVNTTLTVTLPGMDIFTRATSDGLDRFNENTITSVDLFFYPYGQTNQNAKLRKTYTIGSGMTVSGLVATLSSDISINDLRNIFPDYETETGEQTCEVYAIVNLPADATVGENTDIESLKQIELSNPVFGQKNPTNQQINALPTEFVMSGQANNITLAANKRNLSGNVDVYRAASKITLELTGVNPTFTDSYGNVWESQTENIIVSIRHGQTKGYVDDPTTTNITGDYTLKDIRMIPATATTAVASTATGHYATDVPFYSYAHNWTTAQQYRTSLLLTVFWKNTTAGTSYQPTYYEIPIDDENEALIRNTYYKISLEVGVIGSLVEEEPVKMTCSYVILPWGTNSTIMADLNQVRYLVVDETELDMENIIAKTVNFSSSHNIYYANKSLQVMNLTGNTATWTTLDPDEFRVVVTQPTKDNPTGQFVVEHELNNNMQSDGDYTQYKMEFDVYHYDQNLNTTRYKEHIVVYQEPMIYAHAEKNTNGDPTNSRKYGYVFVNGYQNSTNATTRHTGYNSSDYGGVNGLTTSSNNRNPNRYIINATALLTDDYIIGDPRQLNINNDLSTNNNAVLSTTTNTSNTWTAYRRSGGTNYYAYRVGGSGNQNNMLYYHPTEEGGTDSRTYKMVSPEYMVASSYGICTVGRTRTQARRRCASYQEDGYPAGRWRLPTYAEVKYIVQLSAWGVIPVLFGYAEGTTGYTNGSWAYYWTANGVIRVNSRDGYVEPSNTTSDVSVRCIYDTWYWTDRLPESEYDNFYWGDKQTF